jgi:hypothetical protein
MEEIVLRMGVGTLKNRVGIFEFAQTEIWFVPKWICTAKNSDLGYKKMVRKIKIWVCKKMYGQGLNWISASSNL